MVTVKCSECGKEFERHEVIMVSHRWVCVDCAKEWMGAQIGLNTSYSPWINKWGMVG